MKTDRVRVFLLTVSLCSLVAQGSADAAWPKFFKKKNKAPATVPAGEALRAADMDAAALMAKSREAEAAGKEKAALDGYRKIVQNFPYSSHAPVAQFRIAAALEKDRRYEKAFDEYQTLISNYRQTPQFKEALDRQFNIAMMGRNGKINRTLGFKTRLSPEDQITMLNKVIANAPQDSHAAECQYEIGRVHEEEKERDAAIAAYRKVVTNYPRSPLARDAQQKVSETYMAKVEKGSRDASNAEMAREATNEAEALFGNMTPEFSGTVDAIDEAETENAFKTGKFYQKQGKYKSAMIYYADVLKNPGSPYYDDVRERVNEMSVKDPSVKDSLKGLAVNSRNLAVPATADVKGQRNYFGPPGPAVAGNTAPRTGRPAMRGDYVPLAPLEPGELPTNPGTADPLLLDPNTLPPVEPGPPLPPVEVPGAEPPALEPPMEAPPPPTAPADAPKEAAPEVPVSPTEAEPPPEGPVEEKPAIPVEEEPKKD
jgi:tetratricopeptide (TPR) repeat protein